jgi:hypothetical protein
MGLDIGSSSVLSLVHFGLKFDSKLKIIKATSQFSTSNSCGPGEGSLIIEGSLVSCHLGHTGKYFDTSYSGLLLEQTSFEQPIFERIGVIHSPIGRADINYDSVMWEGHGIPQHIYIDVVRSLLHLSRPIIQTLRPSPSLIGRHE